MSVNSSVSALKNRGNRALAHYDLIFINKSFDNIFNTNKI